MVSLRGSQSPDGGWPYRGVGPSWTEPTAYALLALMTRGSDPEPVAKGVAWLKAAQRPDGGWAPQPAIRESTWVTAVTVLLGPAALGEDSYLRGISWIAQQTGADTNLFSRVREFLIGRPRGYPGWPFFPRTSAWVTPTALSMLALRQAANAVATAQFRARLDMGASFLLAHACSQGGWNYGAARAAGYDAESYPETTGVALLALAGRDGPEIRKACRRAQEMLSGCRTSEGESWLRLGLQAHGQLPSGAPLPVCPTRTVQDASLALLASAALAGWNVFLE
ncbi:MAG TPA: prenyltransferase/squalene oxidase repeat-containing protein [Bryobacteraceae bacterium]|nr:prenyltransferase/squalene oxidase repeat-containing protein [Bryobacteraceae bacterium]